MLSNTLRHLFSQSILTQNVRIYHCTLLKTALPCCTSYRYINLKPKLKEHVYCDYVDSMDYGIYSLTTGYIKEAAIEAGRIAINRKAKTKQVWKVVCESPFTKKPLGTRMGKGKGKLAYWAAKAIAGQVLYEFNADNDLLANEAFKQVKAKMPVRVHLRIAPKEEKETLNAISLLDMFNLSEERSKRIASYSKK